MPIINPRVASGFPEYLPEDQIEFNRLLNIIKDIYENYGFSPIDTPDLELREVLLAKGGGETDQQVYDFKHGKNDFCMRFDLTVPLARYTAQHQNELTFPFRRYHIGKVHRAERAQAGRFREFYQCDIDIIGSNSPTVDAEFPVIINEIFTRFAFGKFTIRFNDRRILNGFFENIGLTDSKTNVMRIIDKIEKLSQAEIEDELTKHGITQASIAKLLEFTNISGDNDLILEKLTAMDIGNENFSKGLENLRMLVSIIRAFGVPEENFKIDLKIARGLDYYTGTVYETILDEYPELGSVCSGGRFDDLASYYTESKLPGVGISIGLTRLFYKLREIGVVKSSRKTPASVIVIPLSNGELEFAIKVSRILHKSNVSNILYTEQNSFKKKMRYADQMGFLNVIVIGDREVEGTFVSIKNMLDHTSTTVAIDDLKEFFE